MIGPSAARAAEVTPDTHVDRQSVRLSEPVRVTVSVVGDAPLRVELAKEVLDEPSAAVWRARPDGPAAVTDLPGGKQRWVRTYRLDPYQPGDHAIGFAPVRVFAGTDPQPHDFKWQVPAVRVTTELQGNPTEARPPTGIEELPPAGRSPDSLRQRAALFLAVGVAALAAGAVIVWLMRRRPTPRPTPEQWASARLGELSPANAAFADRLSDAVRAFVEARTGVAATKLTTAELLAGLAAAGPWPAERVADVAAVLDRCDRAKFAGERLGAEEAAELLAVARRVILPEVPPG